jgi:mRNA interferase MazF
VSPPQPARGDIWDVDLNSTKGREQAGRRPALIVSVGPFNQGPADLVVAIPLTRTERKVRWHVPVSPPEGGLADRSFIKCEDVRSLSKSRLARYRGHLSPVTIAEVEDRLRILLRL